MHAKLGYKKPLFFILETEWSSKEKIDIRNVFVFQIQVDVDVPGEHISYLCL